MEKLLLQTLKKQLQQCNSLTGQRTKNTCFSFGATQAFFCQHTGKQLFYSTYFRMNYLSKLITGLINQTSQLFLGQDIFQSAFVPGLTFDECHTCTKPCPLAVIVTNPMTAEQFNNFWASTYPDTILIQHHFRHNFADRWFRIHSLPESKRYAEDEAEWNILLSRQNEIISDLLNDNSNFVLLTGGHSSEGYIEIHPIEEVNSIKEFSFVSLDPIDLNKVSPDEYDKGQFYTPMFSEQNWQPHKFDNLLKDIAEDSLRAFFVSVDNDLIIAPYDGGMDFILKDTKTRDFYKQKYNGWLSARQDGL